MLLAVSAKRSTFTSSASCGSASLSGSAVAIVLQVSKSFRATMKSVEVMVRFRLLPAPTPHRLRARPLQQQHSFKRCSAASRRENAFTLFHRAIIAPPQMRGSTAQRPPRLGERRHLLFRRPRLQAEPDADALLHGEVAVRPRVTMAQTKQKIVVRGPRPDAGQRDQRVVRVVGMFFGEH